MEFDIELYRRDVLAQNKPRVRLSVIDVCPDNALDTVVMLHGFGGCAAQWKYQFYALADTYRCIAIDLRGHGRSDVTVSEYSVDEMISDILAVLHELDVTEPFTLMGHSFGGALATTFAHRFAQRVGRLILIASADRFELPFYSRWALSLPTPVLNAARPFYRGQLFAPPMVLKRYWRNGLARYKGEGMMRSLTMPVLVIRGDRDLVFPTANYESVARLIPRAEEVNVGASRHMVIIERRDALQRALERFLGRGSSSWRNQDAVAQDRARILRERPWLKSYDEGVPFTISLPDRPITTLLSSAARRFRSRTASVFYGSRMSYGELDSAANALAQGLRRHGVSTGTRVAVLLPNCPQWIISFFGVLRAGGIVVGISPAAPLEENLREMADAGARVLITLSRFAIRGQAALAEGLVDKVIYTRIGDGLDAFRRAYFYLDNARRDADAMPVPMSSSELEWAQLLQGQPATAPDINIAPNNLALIQYTGGTTDSPKGVMLSHKALIANAFQVRHWLPGLREGGERVLAVVPFAHSYGLTACMTCSIALGASIIILPQFITAEVLKTIKRDKPTLFPGVPSMYVAINNFPGVRKYNIRSIRACISGAAPLPIEVQEAFERLTRGRLVEGYGLTEASPVTHANPIVGLRRTGSIGVPLPSTEARIVSLSTGEALPPGQVGELVIRGPQLMSGYWGRDIESEQMLRGGWLYTGDIARMDEEGYFQIISRKKDMWYLRRGEDQREMAFPRDVEEVIYELPEVTECAVVGVRDFPVAFVTVNRSVAPGTIREYCARRLPPELVPHLVFIVDELPKSFVGKVIRRSLLDNLPEPQRRQLDILSDRIDEMLDFPGRSDSSG